MKVCDFFIDIFQFESNMIDKDNFRALPLDGHVGFDSLPDQQVNKAVQKGFVFNILCVGKKFKEIGLL